MSTPTIPPRPSRNQAQGGPTAVKQEMPLIPPRPRKTDPSPDREAYTRSPLNFLPNSNGTPFKPPPPPSPEEKRRPSSIAFPSHVGEEGLEYSSFDQLPPEAHGVGNTAPPPTEQTKNVSADVPLHQPKASFASSTAKNRIATVTRTDSTQAAAAGIGKAQPDDDVHKGSSSDGGASLSRVTSRQYDDGLRRVPSADPHPLRAQASASFGRPSSSAQGSTPRPPSVHSVDQREGIPEIGMQIPLYKNAGDVQAPSPAPQAQFASGIGFFNDGSASARPGSNHHRKRSSRHDFGGYGLHGHDAEPQDQFEKAWHAKHPDEANKEHYNPYLLRPETALSTDQLNKIVSEEKDIGFGTSSDAIGIPTHDIAYQATQEFTSRNTTPQPSPLPISETKKRSSGTQAPVESPLRKASFPFGNGRARSDKAVESEDDDVIHVGPSARRGSKTTGGGPADNTIDLGPTGGNTEEAGGWFVERGEGTPILASDELMKRPSSAFMQPAVNPEDHSVDDSNYESDDVYTSRRNSLRPNSRPSSRPNSVHGNWHGGPLHRFISHDEHHGSGLGTPLEEIEEYEPLFPEEEDEEGQPKKVAKKRPGLAEHHFPSQDVWEDTPSSLQYQAYVHTPEPEAQATSEQTNPVDANPAKVFETPEQEEARKTENPADMTSDSKTFSKPHFKPGVMDDLNNGRPGMQRRFPSQDIWEDTPDSATFTTTVSSPQMDEARSPPEDRPTTAAMPGSHEDETSRSTTGFTQVARPSVPSRPERKSKLAQEIKPDSDPREKEVPDLGSTKEQVPDRTKPMIPERPKPSVPARPTRGSNSDSAEGAPLSKPMSAASAGSGVANDTVTSPPAQKVKPAVPARPAGSKIAALQSGFMNDLNNRLKLGPQGPPPKVKEPETEDLDTPKEALTDARKSRAKGPARRKPAASPSAAGFSSSDFSFSTPTTLWHIDENDELNVAAEAAVQDDVEPIAALESALAANEKQNMEDPTMPIKSESMSEGSDDKFDANPPAAVGAEGDKVESSISPAIAEEQKAVQPEISAALAQAEPAPANAQEEQAKEEQEMAAPPMKAAFTGLSTEENTRTTAHAGDVASTDGEGVVRDGE
ncbi:hypothetical protein LTR27_000707 [Elasticomyces elasticus]|nr:hypothetical protein LTR27_000707 [Elasticomyces elasticus]